GRAGYRGKHAPARERHESVTRATASGHIDLAQSLSRRMQVLTERLTLLRELTLQSARSDVSSG
ncbi:MAG: hypothetical protein V4637_18810, partial [Pseudomonadota bacterium]